MIPSMSDPSNSPDSLDPGRPSTEELFEIVYDELKKVANFKVGSEPQGQSLNATALVHEAYLRLEGNDRGFENPRHLFATASEAMRWILIDRAKARRRQKRGGDSPRAEFVEAELEAPATDDQLLAVDEALKKLEIEDPESADLVKMHFFSGFTLREISAATEVPYRTLKRQWAFAKAWLKATLETDF